MLPRQHFAQNDAEREQVAALIYFLPQDLLRRHVSNCAEDLTRNT